MEVISGMAPRPSTPQPYAARPASAPNSPARNAFAIPGINRLPSQDSLDRSIHNESGHGKSTAQIVRDLKQANAQLSAKMAAMEAKFMNQISLATNELKGKHEEQARTLKQRCAQLEAFKAAADVKLKEKDSHLSKSKEESAFQRHTISDLKNQLYQLQQELDDQELSKRDEFDQLLLDNQEMAKELQNLQSAKQELEGQLQGENPSQDYYRQWQETKEELENLRKQVSGSESQIETIEATLTKEHSYQVEELKEKLHNQADHFKTRERDLQDEIERLEFTDSQVTMQLRAQLEERDDTIMELQNQLDEYAEGNAALTHALEQVRKDSANQEQYRRDEAEDLRILHDAQEEEITKLRKDLDDAQRELELRDSELEEKDLELKDAGSKKEVEELKKELEQSHRELGASQRKLAGKLESAESTSNERSLPENREDPGLIRDLEEQLVESREQASRFEDQVADIQNEHKIALDSLQSTVDSLTKETEDLSKQLTELRTEKDNAVTNLKEKDDEFSQLKGHWEKKSGAETEVSKLLNEIDILKKRVQDTIEAEREANSKLQECQKELKDLENLKLTKSINDAEVKRLKKGLDMAEAKATAESFADSEEMTRLRKEKAASDEEAKRLKKELELAETKAAQADSNSLEVERLQRELELAEATAAQNTAETLEECHKEISNLKESLQNMESDDSNNNNRLKKQLRDAQVALVALDDEKKEMTKQHRELLSAVVKKKEEIQRETKKELGANDAEMKKQIAKVEELEAEKDALEQRKQSLESELKIVTSATPVRRIRLLEQEIEQLKLQKSVPASDEERLDKSKIQALTDEKDALKTKLKDRDTTIAALVRSSVSLEAKISSKEQEIQEVADQKRAVESELAELRKSIAVYQEREPKIKEDLITLGKELKMAKSDAKRWKRALQQDGSTGSEYRFHIAMLQKEIEDQANKVEERDRAIENLVNQSISQDAHVKDLKTRISALIKEVESVRMQRNKFEDGALKNEVRRLQQESEIFAGQIIEQDEELQALKRNLQARDEQVASFKKEIATSRSLKAEPTSSSQELSSLKKEVSKLQKDLTARDSQLTKLAKELEEAISHKGANSNNSSSSDDAKKIGALQAELDELQEASDSNRIELRDLRTQLWQAKQAAGEVNDLKLELAQAKYELDEFIRTGGLSQGAVKAEKLNKESAKKEGSFDSAELQAQLDEALESNKALEQKMAKQLEIIRSSNTDAVSKLEAELKDRETKIKGLQVTSSDTNEEEITVFQTEIEGLRRELSIQTDLINELRRELGEKETALEKSEMLKLKLVGELADTKKLAKQTTPASEEGGELVKRNESLVEQNEEMLQEITNLKTEMESSKKELQGIENLKAELEQAKKARESTEQNIVESYERQLSAIANERDEIIVGLRRELEEMGGRDSEDVNAMMNELNALQGENHGLREQFEVELQAKNQQIYALEHTLHAQELIVENMRSEMDQLQSGMEHATEKRRGEVEDLQQEVMQIESRAAKQDREIVALRMQLEESKLEHKAEVVRLKDVIVTMEKESPLAKQVAELQNDDRMLEVRERLEQLKVRNTKLQEENLKLGGRLERSIIEIKSFEAERSHGEEMEKENSVLRGQVKELEKILGGARKSRGNKDYVVPSQTAVDKENPVKITPEKVSKKKKGIGGLFKRRNFS